MKDMQDLTTGSVSQKLLGFALPLLLANLLQSFYSIVDLLVVGQIVGNVGLAAISNASMLSFLINAVCTGVTIGGTVLAAQYKGAQDEQGQRETSTALGVLTLLSAIIVTALGLWGYRPLFALLEVPAAALPDACGYMRIVCWGTIFVFGYNAVCAILKGLGDAKQPLYFVLAAAIVNVGLDLLLVGPLGLGTRGAAYATVLAQGAAFLAAFIYYKRMTAARLTPQKFALKADKLLALLRIGLPTALQMAVVNLSYLCLTGMLNHFGIAVTAAAGIGLKVNTMAGMPCWAIGQAVTAMAGQNNGARLVDRVRSVTQIGLRLNLVVTLCVIISVQLLAEPILLLFDPAHTVVTLEGIRYLRLCCGLNSLVYAAMYTFDSFAISVGAAYIALLNALLDAVIIRLPLSWLLAFTFDWGAAGIYVGQAFSPLVPALIGAYFFHSRRWIADKSH